VPDPALLPVSQTIRTGFSAIGGENIKTAFRTAHGSSFDFVEVQMDHWDREWLQLNGDQLQNMASDAAVDVLVHLPYGAEHESIAASDPAVRARSMEWFQSCIETAASVGANKGVLHVETDEDSPHLANDGRLDELADTLRELDRFADDQEFTICIENLPGRYPHLDDLKTLARTTDLRFTVDTGHAKVNGYSDGEVARFVAGHGDQISHFHLNDTRKPADEHLPFGAGNIDFGQILGKLPSSWTGTLTTEIKTSDYDYIAFSGEKLADTLVRCCETAVKK
jgi:sugar phosphate isomerase/epimerase